MLLSDDEILRVFSKYTLDFPNLVGMLWGKKTTWTEEPEDELNELSRKKRQAPGPEMFVYNDQNGLLVVFREVILTIFNKGEAYVLQNFTLTFIQKEYLISNTI